MKTMTCRQLGGACDHAFHGDTFDDMAAQSQAHARAMFAAQDADHLAAMEAMSVVMAHSVSAGRGTLQAHGPRSE